MWWLRAGRVTRRWVWCARVAVVFSDDVRCRVCGWNHTRDDTGNDDDGKRRRRRETTTTTTQSARTNAFVTTRRRTRTRARTRVHRLRACVNTCCARAPYKVHARPRPRCRHSASRRETTTTETTTTTGCAVHSRRRRHRRRRRPSIACRLSPVEVATLGIA